VGGARPERADPRAAVERPRAGYHTHSVGNQAEIGATCSSIGYPWVLHYDRALAEGLPIATGVIEGACRYLVKDRMGRTGARWSLTGAEAVLRLRALRASGDFDDYWLFHLEQEHQRTHQSRYAGAAMPNPLPPRRPQLKLVK
jgi:hypothetical protein